MAGTKKKKFDDAPVSKTARASAKGKKKEEGFIASGEVDRIISLAHGEWAYVLASDGKTHHVKVGSSQWASTINELLIDPRFGTKTNAQVDKFCWRDLLDLMTVSVD